MIEELRISGLGVIDSSTLELGAGLTVVTGETGAGKTMLVTALGLLLGGRADRGAVRLGARHTRVEGTLDLADPAAVSACVEERGGEVEDGRVLVARQVTDDGRSRAFLGGAAVPASALSDVVGPLVAVHGQSDQHRLLHRNAQREALDRFAGVAVAELTARWSGLYEELRALEEELLDVLGNARERIREAEALRFGLEEIASVDPTSGEEVALAAEESRLAFADTLRVAAEEARRSLSDDDAGVDARGAVASSRARLDSVRDHDPQAAALSDRVAEVGYLLDDLAAELASYAQGIETDPARLAVVSERRAALRALTRKYGENLDEVLAWAAGQAARLAELDGAEDRTVALRERRAALRQGLAEVGAALSAARTEAAGRLADGVTAELAALAMPHSRVEVRVGQQEVAAPQNDGPGRPLEVGERWLRYAASGLDEIEFLLAANPGAEARSLAKGASGGELSRVMLGVEVVLAGTSPVPTLVFDEVDAGVGGRAALEVGRRLAALARSAQVLVVTHLPQVAAYADRHVVVRKDSDGSVTTSGLRTLEAAERVRELSRMLAGQEDSETALAHAEELLTSAREDRAAAT